MALFCFYLCKFLNSSLSHNSSDGHANTNFFIFKGILNINENMQSDIFSATILAYAI